jgi:hypothetical protein
MNLRQFLIDMSIVAIVVLLAIWLLSMVPI